MARDASKQLSRSCAHAVVQMGNVRHTTNGQRTVLDEAKFAPLGVRAPPLRRELEGRRPVAVRGERPGGSSARGVMRKAALYHDAPTPSASSFTIRCHVSLDAAWTPASTAEPRARPGSRPRRARRRPTPPLPVPFPSRPPCAGRPTPPRTLCQSISKFKASLR